jgi:hypothetical protein
MAGAKIALSSTTGELKNDGNGNALVALPSIDTPAAVGALRVYQVDDPGLRTGEPHLNSFEVDEDYRARVGQDALIDEERFNYTAQNTGKFAYRNTTATITWSASGMLLNASGITTTTTGVGFQSYSEISVLTATTLYTECAVAFPSTTCPTNVVFDFGSMRTAVANPYAPTDGIFWRMKPAGLVGVMNFNGSETEVPLTDASNAGANWVPVVNKAHRFIIAASNREVEFWIDGELWGTGATPTGNHAPFAGTSLPCFASRWAIVGGAAGAVYQPTVKIYGVSIGGVQVGDRLSVVGNRLLGSYSGLSGGTMGSLSTYPNSTNPTAAAPSNTALTANLPAGLGGQGSVIAAVAAAADGIWGSYQVPVGTAAVQGKRLAIRGVYVSCVNLGAAVTTTATTIQFSLAFGHTAVSLATAEGAAAKAPRRVPLGFATWPVGAAIGAQPQSGPLFVDFGDAAIYVNPGEFVALVGKFLVGTATASQVIGFVWQPVYGWE